MISKDRVVSILEIRLHVARTNLSNYLEAIRGTIEDSQDNYVTTILTEEVEFFEYLLGLTEEELYYEN